MILSTISEHGSRNPLSPPGTTTQRINGALLVSVVKAATGLNSDPTRRLVVDALERMTGIEPAFSAWEADVLPLNDIRVEAHPSLRIPRLLAAPTSRSPPPPPIRRSRSQTLPTHR